MDRKVQLVTSTKTKSGTGAETGTDVVICEPFAFMEEINGDEVPEGKVIALVNRYYTVRYRSEIKQEQNKLILIDEGRRFEVNNILEIGRKSHLKLVCRIYE